MDANSRDTQTEANVVTCIECGCLSSLQWAGWRAYRVDDPELGEPPALAFFCPGCADREIGFELPLP